MSAAASVESSHLRIASFTHEAGNMPIPGYRLICPLGRGGFGEVWKCEAPGGIQKAIKIIKARHPNAGGSGQAEKEHRALKRIVGIRHPFILQLDRIEETDNELLIVMELADRTLHELLQSYRQAGFAGIPREELLSYLAEAAEALDHMNQVHGLLHLDIKPGNLFVVTGHVKVADFGLVTDLGHLNDGSQTATQASEALTGITPLYVAPETLQGKMHKSSDQYSLAIVFQELLTGVLPFSGKNPRQLAMQHMMAEPNLQPLGPEDVPIIARALNKNPDQRFASCLALVHALVSHNGAVEQRGEVRSSARIIRKLQGLDTAKEINLASTDFSAEESLSGWSLPDPSPRSELPGHQKEQPLRSSPVPPSSVPPPTIPRLPAKSISAGSLSRSSVSLPCMSPGINAEILPGYTFLECVGRSPLGELWRIAGPDGQPALVKFVNGFGGQDPVEEERAISFLQSLKHPGLLPCEVIPAGPGRLCLLSDVIEETLWERFGHFRGKRLPGVPRQEILPLLREAATTLDDLYQRFELLHLAINPRNLLLPGQAGLLIAQFGLAHLLWAPASQALFPLNSRYAAPELAENVIHRSSDIYSLALVYQELVTGIHPLRSGSIRGGAGRVVGAAGASPSHSGVPPHASHSGRSGRSAKPDLESLQPAERAVLARAFDVDVDQRFGSCLEFIDALEQCQIGGAPYERPKKTGHHLAATTGIAPVIHAHQLSDSIPPAQVVSEIVGTIMAAWPVEMINANRYIHRRGELLHHRCGAMLVSGMAKAKLDGFRLSIGAELAQSEDNVFVYRVPHLIKSFWKRTPAGGLEITLHLAKPHLRTALLTGVTVQIKPYGMADHEAADALLSESGPRIIESLRTFLQATHDRRAHERFEYNLPLKVVAFTNRGERGTAIQCQGKDISLGGLSFYSPLEIRTPFLKVELMHPALSNPIPVITQLMRCDRHVQGSWFEVGIKFDFENELRAKGLAR